MQVFLPEEIPVEPDIPGTPILETLFKAPPRICMYADFKNASIEPNATA